MNICGDLDFEEGGNPVTMNRILCARDPVLVDAFACRTLGYDMDEVTYISLAEKLGVGSANVENAELLDLNKGTFAAPTRTAPGQKTGRIRGSRQCLQRLLWYADSCSG